jgi:hypothetical protein
MEEAREAMVLEPHQSQLGDLPYTAAAAVAVITELLVLVLVVLLYLAVKAAQPKQLVLLV